MGIGARRQGLGGVANQAVDADLIHTGAVKKRCEGMPAVMGSMIGVNADGQ